MKVALVAITDTTTPARKLAQRMCPPLGLLYLKAYVEERMPEAAVLWTWDADDALAFGADIIGLSTVTENFPQAVITAVVNKSAGAESIRTSMISSGLSLKSRGTSTAPRDRVAK